MRDLQEFPEPQIEVEVSPYCNVANMRQAIDYLRNLPSDSTLDMRTWGQRYAKRQPVTFVPWQPYEPIEQAECGTAACIAGHIGIMLGAPYNPMWGNGGRKAFNNWLGSITVWLGLHPGTAEDLYHVSHGGVNRLNPANVTVRDAVEAMENIITHGHPNWPGVLFRSPQP